MAKVAETKNLDNMKRRVASVANHLAPSHSSPNFGAVELSTTMNDTYHRIHGEVPVHPVVWRTARGDDSGKDSVDIIYEKAAGEGIAKPENLERETIKWCREILRNSPTALRVLKSALNAVDDGHAGVQLQWARPNALNSSFTDEQPAYFNVIDTTK